MNYIVVHKDRSDEFDDLVQAYINNGWTLQGGVSVLDVGDGKPRFFQALVRHNDSKQSEVDIRREAIERNLFPRCDDSRQLRRIRGSHIERG